MLHSVPNKYNFAILEYNLLDIIIFARDLRRISYDKASDILHFIR